MRLVPVLHQVMRLQIEARRIMELRRARSGREAH
jgi:hypothetical protein